MTDEERERQDLLDKLRNIFQICEDAADEIERLANDPLSREHQNPSKWPSRDASAGLIEAAENVVIAFGMGWDMEGAIERLTETLPQDSVCRARAADRSAK